MIGLVHYADDAGRKVFRKVYLSPGESLDVLDDPRWITEGCDPARIAVLVKSETDAPLNGTP